MIDDGFVECPQEGWRFTSADGSLRDRVEKGPYASLETLDPTLVYEDRTVLSGKIASVDVAWLSVVRFTSSGEVRILSETPYL